MKSIAASERRADENKVLSVTCERTKAVRVILLRQAWVDSPCKPGAHVHVVGDFDCYGQCIIDNTQNLLILHPDHLISATVVGTSFTCIRKSVLEDRVKTTSESNESLVYGHILHEVFQESLKANRWDDESMLAIIDNVATKHLEALFEINIEHVMAIDQLKARATDLQNWAKIFIAVSPKVGPRNHFYYW